MSKKFSVLEGRYLLPKSFKSSTNKAETNPIYKAAFEQSLPSLTQGQIGVNDFSVCTDNNKFLIFSDVKFLKFRNQNIYSKNRTVHRYV